MGKDTRLQFRVTEHAKKRADRCAETVGMDLTTLGGAAMDALCDYIEAHGEITMPLVVLPKSTVTKGKPTGRYANDPEAQPFFSSSSAAAKSAPSLNDPSVKYLPKKKTKPPKKT